MQGTPRCDACSQARVQVRGSYLGLARRILHRKRSLYVSVPLQAFSSSPRMLVCGERQFSSNLYKDLVRDWPLERRIRARDRAILFPVKILLKTHR